jgi:hypothetical protein
MLIADRDGKIEAGVFVISFPKFPKLVSVERFSVTLSHSLVQPWRMKKMP